MKFVLIILSFFIIVNVSAVNVSGKVTNDKGEPLAYAGIYIKGTTLGTTTNIDGNFQFNLKEGNYELVFQYIGYKKHIEKITITNKPISLKIKLQSENISLKEVVITASQEDPAYPVIRNAIAKRKYYLEQVEKYQCRVFTKGIMRLTDAPNKILGKKLDEERDSIKGIIYLSESESDISFKQPDKMKEVMVSSKVSGDSKGFSVNFYTFFTTSFYENLVNPAIGNRRGFVSPISTSALFYYKYHLEGTFVEGNDIIYKIKVIPKRKADPVFSGDIYIVDNSWRIYSVNLIIGKEAHINFIDTVRISQQYFAATDSVWMIFNQKMEFKFRFNFFGKVFAGNGVFHSQNTNYKFDMVYPDDYFTKEIIKVEKDANKKDSAYWEKSRPIPLTEEEKGNYKKEDSIYIIHNSKAYLDSMDRKSNKFSLSDLWSSYRYRNRYDSIEFTVKSPLMATSFNTVQGLNTDLTLGYSKEYESGNKLNINHKLTYGFSDKQLRYRFNTTYLYSREDRGNISFTATYKDAMQINNSNPISDLSNTIYTLFIKSNYLKLYEKSAININNNYEAYLIKTTRTGTVLWQKTYDIASSITKIELSKNNDGYIAVGGAYGSTSNLGRFFFISKINDTGAVVWSKTFTGINKNEMANNFCYDNSGNLMVAGSAQAIYQNNDLYITKLNSNGDTIWAKSISGNGYETCSNIINLGNNNFIICSSSGYHTNPLGITTITQTDTAGNLNFLTNFQSTNPYSGDWIIKTNDNQLLLTGSRTDSVGNNPCYLTKMDITGNVLWTKTYGNSQYYTVHHVMETNDSYIIAGAQNVPTDSTHALLIKVKK